MGDVNVLPSVAIHIGGVDTHTGLVPSIFACCNSRDERNVLECAVVFIDEQEVWPRIVCDSDIGPAIIVEVGQDNAHALGFRLSNSGGVAYIGEGSVVIVVIELDVLAFVISR